MTTPFISNTFACRPLYSDGMFLTSAIMSQEQSYLINWLTLQNQLLYTSGVLTGLVVSNAGGNTLAVATGAGFDDSGNFLTVANGGLTITVTSSQASPCYLYLTMPVPPPPSPSTTTFNAAAVAVLSSNPPTSQPSIGLALAQISLDGKGSITGITNYSTPVHNKITVSQAKVSAEQDMVPTAQAPMLEGTVLVPTSTLTQPGQSITQTVSFLPDDTPAFAAPPRVFVTPQSATPYATSVSNVTTSQFSLTLGAVAAATDDQPVPVYWLALI